MYFGSSDAVMKVITSKMIAYEIKCPMSQCAFKGKGIDVHFVKKT